MPVLFDGVLCSDKPSKDSKPCKHLDDVASFLQQDTLTPFAFLSQIFPPDMQASFLFSLQQGMLMLTRGQALVFNWVSPWQQVSFDVMNDPDTQYHGSWAEYVPQIRKVGLLPSQGAATCRKRAVLCLSPRFGTALWYASELVLWDKVFSFVFGVKWLRQKDSPAPKASFKRTKKY